MEPTVNAPVRNSGSILDSPEVGLVLKALRKNWWIILLLGAMGYAIGYLYAYRLPDVYAAQTQLLLKENDQYEKGVINPMDAFGVYQGYVDNFNEIRVIQSYDLIKQVVDKLNVNVSYFIEGRLRKTEVYSLVPFKITPYYINQAFYGKEINFTILDKYHFKISYSKGDELYSQNGNFGDDFINMDMKLHVSRTMELDPNSMEDIKHIDYKFIVFNTSTMVSKFSSSINVKNPDYTNVLEISIQDMIPSRAVAFLDTLDRLYIENTVNTAFRKNANTLLYIDKEMKEVSDIIDTIEYEIEKYKENKNIISIEKEDETYFKQYDDFTNTKNKIISELGALNDLEQYIIEGKDPEFLPPSVYLNSEDELLKQMTNELYTLQLKIIASLGSNTTEQNQNVIDAKKDIKRITSDMLTYINNSRRAFNDKLALTDSAINKCIIDIRNMPEKRRGLLNMQRQEDVNTRLYESMLEKRATTIIEKAAIIPETKILETARSIGVVSPNRSRIYNTYLGIGIAIAVLIALIRVLFFDRIESLKELKSKTSLPVLGEILAAPSLTDLSFAIEDNPKSPLTESFRMLRTNLQYMLTEPSQKVILFTSNGPSEGKTFCSMNIAAILAKAEKKVLLLEFDLHKPRIHKVLNVTPDKGLSTIIIKKTTIEESIIPSPVTGLDVILCGPIPPNSSELILSEKVKEIINYGRANYDYVVIDTPPLGFISDAIILMNLSDANLFVLNTKFAYKASINYVQETIQANKIKHFGFVLNNVKQKKSKYYYNRYGYYSGYGYGYGYGYGGYGSN
ncbi:MAG: polysaccharide biosynthesis tyrosine autokinase [Bacteroidia bacterium]